MTRRTRRTELERVAHLAHLIHREDTPPPEVQMERESEITRALADLDRAPRVDPAAAVGVAIAAVLGVAIVTAVLAGVFAFVRWVV
jgi:hypothetical protein